MAPQPVDVRGLVHRLEAQLQGAGIPASRSEAEWLLADTLGLRRTELYLWDQPIPPQRLELVSERVARRVGGEPLQYILESCEFCGLRLWVGPGVFIPRPETEVLAQQAIGWLKRRAAAGGGAARVLELGSGSGCLAISLAAAASPCTVTAVELSWKALQAARTNIRTHRLDHRIRLVQSDWSTGIRGQFELVVSNPPYVPDGEVVRRHGRLAERSERSAFRGFSEAASGDPEMSVRGGADGMVFLRRLLEEAPALLSPGGALLMECAETQAGALGRMASVRPWTRGATIYHDLAGCPRGLVIESV